MVRASRSSTHHQRGNRLDLSDQSRVVTVVAQVVEQDTHQRHLETQVLDVRPGAMERFSGIEQLATVLDSAVALADLRGDCGHVQQRKSRRACGRRSAVPRRRALGAARIGSRLALLVPASPRRDPFRSASGRSPRPGSPRPFASRRSPLCRDFGRLRETPSAPLGTVAAPRACVARAARSSSLACDGSIDCERSSAPRRQAVLAGDVALQIPSHGPVSFEPIGLLRDQAGRRNQVLRLDFGADHVLVERHRHFAGDAVVVVEQDGRGGLDLEQTQCPLACGARDAIAVRRVRGERLGDLQAFDSRAAARTAECAC